MSASARRAQRGEGVVGIEGGEEGQAGHEGGVLLGRRADELGEPVSHLDRAGIGDRVDGALGALALLDGAGGLDEALLLQGLDDGVEDP